MSEKELELELKRLKEELALWKGKYEEALAARKEMEAKLAAAGGSGVVVEGGGNDDKSNGPQAPQAQPQPAAPTGAADRAPVEPAVSGDAGSAAARPAPPRARPPVPGGARVPVLDRSKKELKELDDDILSKPYLKKLYLFQNLLAELPPAIGNFTELQLLDVKYNRLTALPNEICALSTLSELCLGGNQIARLPPDLSSLTALTRLDLAQNGLKQIPPSLGGLAGLTELCLERNMLSSVDGKLLAAFPSLHKLDLSVNKLEKLPDDFPALLELEQLMLSKNHLSRLPNAIGELVNLRELALDDNRLSTLPESIGYLTALTKLSLKRNELSELPETVGVNEERGWYSMQHLNLSHNRFQHMPAQLWTMEAIEVLDMASNAIESVPADIAALYYLRTLILTNNRITSLPADIAALEALDILNLSFNGIAALPDEIGQLYALRELFVGYNKLESFPDVSALQGLEQLFLAGNKNLSKGLHESIWTQSSLRLLHLHHVGLAAVPSSIGGLSALEILDLSGNELTSFPAEIEGMASLARLNLSHNQLDSLPEQIDDLRELAELDLTANRFSELPSVYTYIKDRVEVLLDDNPVAASMDKAHHPLMWESSKRFRHDCAEMLGRRPTMEDAFSIRGAFMGKEDVDYFGLFDGHAGRIAATFCAEHMHNEARAQVEASGADWESALAAAYPAVNARFKAFLDSADSSHRHAGTTGVAVVIDKERMYVANVGDSRAVLSRAGRALRLSFDHKPYDEEEQQRIRSLGGYVVGETGRVNGLLAVSRSIGDFYMQPFVSDEAYRATYPRKGEDAFLIIACDGVWDEVSDEEAVALLSAETDPFFMGCKLRDFAYLLGSDDNISVIMVMLKDA